MFFSSFGIRLSFGLEMELFSNYNLCLRSLGICFFLLFSLSELLSG